MNPFLNSNRWLKQIPPYRVEPLHLIRNSSIKYVYSPRGMKLQSFDLRLLCITFYIIQRTSKIMHNLYPNPKTYLGMSFNRSLKYLKTLPYFRFISLYLWIQRYQGKLMIYEQEDVTNAIAMRHGLM